MLVTPIVTVTFSLLNSPATTGSVLFNLKKYFCVLTGTIRDIGLFKSIVVFVTNPSDFTVVIEPSITADCATGQETMLADNDNALKTASLC